MFYQTHDYYFLFSNKKIEIICFIKHMITIFCLATKKLKLFMNRVMSNICILYNIWD